LQLRVKVFVHPHVLQPLLARGNFVSQPLRKFAGQFFKFLSRLLDKRNVVLRKRRESLRGEKPHIVEECGVVGRYGHGVHTAHRQTRYGAVRLVALRAVALLDERHYLPGKSRFRAPHPRLDVHVLRFPRHIRTFPRRGVEVCYPVRHHHYHRLRAALRNHIVHYLREPPHAEPCHFVPARAVEEVKHGVSLLAVGRVLRRQVHRKAALRHVRIEGRGIPYLLHLSVRHGEVAVEVARRSVHDEIAQRVVNVAHCARVERVGEAFVTGYLSIEGGSVKAENVGTGYQYIYGKDDIFAVVIMLKYMLTESDFTDFVNEVSYDLDLLDGRVNIIPRSKILDRMGFPSNWEEIAKIK